MLFLLLILLFILSLIAWYCVLETLTDVRFQKSLSQHGELDPYERPSLLTARFAQAQKEQEEQAKEEVPDQQSGRACETDRQKRAANKKTLWKAALNSRHEYFLAWSSWLLRRIALPVLLLTFLLILCKSALR